MDLEAAASAKVLDEAQLSNALRGTIGRHDANRRYALPLKPRRLGAGLGGGMDHQPMGRRQTECGLIGGAHAEVGVGQLRP